MGDKGMLLLMTFRLTLRNKEQCLWAVCHYQKFEFHQQQKVLATHFDFMSFSALPLVGISLHFLEVGTW